MTVQTPEMRAKATALVESLADRLPPDRLARYRQFAFVGEWGELADNLAAGLVNRRIPVTAEEKEALREVLYSFELPYPGHRFIERRDEILAALTMAG
ncbi:hypothetical protein Actkin_00593 [Actinokineospora sp. UTMC 2448]|nr:hypothetical protein Actkin_00593 [Actinokineospora sp. UTMC 2448]